MFYTIKFFIRDHYYALINCLWRKLYRSEHSRFVEEFLKDRVSAGDGDYWKAIIEYHMSKEKN